MPLACLFLELPGRCTALRTDSLPTCLAPLEPSLSALVAFLTRPTLPAHPCPLLNSFVLGLCFRCFACLMPLPSFLVTRPCPLSSAPVSLFFLPSLLLPLSFLQWSHFVPRPPPVPSFHTFFLSVCPSPPSSSVGGLPLLSSLVPPSLLPPTSPLFGLYAVDFLHLLLPSASISTLSFLTLCHRLSLLSPGNLCFALRLSPFLYPQPQLTGIPTRCQQICLVWEPPPPPPLSLFSPTPPPDIPFPATTELLVVIS